MIASSLPIGERGYRRHLVRRLVPLRLPGGPDFVDALRRAWDDGDAILPVDTRLSDRAADRLLSSMRVDDPVEEGDALVVATSGTSGEPKGVVLTHDAMRASATATSARLDVRVDDGGEIHLRGPMLLRAYRDGADPKDADGWFATGDLGTLDPDSGRLQVHGRSTDLIISGGENVWPDAVESVLGEDPDIAEVAVVGRADDEWGQRVVAVVVPRNAARPPTLDRLRASIKERIRPWAAPP